MKVTNTINSYINTEVSKRVYEKYGNLLEKRTEEHEKYKGIIIPMLEKYNEQAVAELKKAGLKYPKYPFSFSWSGYISNISDQEFSDWNRMVSAEIRQETTRIIAILEMGGSKGDLDKLLSEI